MKKHIENEPLLALSKSLDNYYSQSICYPPKPLMFEAFNLCSLSDLKVIILGQDPYHGPQQANGLAFSVPFGVSHPPSLKNILIELSNDLDIAYPISGSLAPWASQGVLLLNTALSVEKGKAGSHTSDWKHFTKSLIAAISKEKNDLVFVLWGGHAQKFEANIDTQKHAVVKGGHPSPLSANRGYWFGNKHFSTVNRLLKEKSKKPINWDIEDCQAAH